MGTKRQKLYFFRQNFHTKLELFFQLKGAGGKNLFFFPLGYIVDIIVFPPFLCRLSRIYLSLPFFLFGPLESPSSSSSSSSSSWEEAEAAAKAEKTWDEYQEENGGGGKEGKAQNWRLFSHPERGFQS